MNDSQEMIYDVSERIATITINRPDARNAINANVTSGINSMLDQAVADKDVSAIILTGAGGKAFCAGADLAGSFSPDASFLDHYDRRDDYPKLLLKMNRCRKPILAAVEGYCLAGGMGLCLASDIVIASDDSQFGCPEIKRGLWPYMVTAILIRNLGRKKALELCMTGDRISADEAEKIGMINYSVPKAEFKTRVDEMAKKLASFSPAVMALGKTSFYIIADLDVEAGLDYLKWQLAINTQLEDIKEGITAFFEKREPEWKGR